MVEFHVSSVVEIYPVSQQQVIWTKCGTLKLSKVALAGDLNAVSVKILSIVPQEPGKFVKLHQSKR